MSPTNNESRPERRLEAAGDRWAATSTTTLEQLASQVEDRRRTALCRDLHRLADRLELLDLPAAQLARLFAQEAA